MNILMNDLSVLDIKLDLLGTTTLACLLLLLGCYLKEKISFLAKFCFPSPVIGGFIFAIVALIGHSSNTFAFTLDTTLQSPFMLAFFTTVGLSGSFALLKKGGKVLLIYLLVCWFVALMQNTLGSTLASLLGLHPLLGVTAGAVSLEGGHSAAAAFAPLIEALNVPGAYAVAISAATFGLIAGSLTGGPLAHWLIKKHNLKIETDTKNYSTHSLTIGQQSNNNTSVSIEGIFKIAALIGILSILGMMLTHYVSQLGFKEIIIPQYVGAMFAAVIVRNLNDKYHFIHLNTRIIDVISHVSLGLFLTMAMMSLKIWDLAGLALPLFIILILQVVMLLLIARFILFPAAGANYDAAVICAGLLGHGLGATPNAVANMGAVSDRYGVRSEKAFLIVPLCGAVLIDLFAIPCIVFFIKLYSGG